MKAGKCLFPIRSRTHGTTKTWWESVCPFQQQRSARVNLFVIDFLIAPKMVQVWEEKTPEKEGGTE